MYKRQGNAFLDYDDHFGELSDVGVSYLTRIGPSQFFFTADDDGGFEIGTSYQRPIGNKDYRFSTRFRESELIADDGVTVFDSSGLGFVSEFTFGSTVFDLGLGFEKLESDQATGDRVYASFGASRKWGVLTGSAEAHFGEIEGQSESAYALGLRYDIARGLSLNLGVNYSDAQVELGGIQILNDSGTSGTLSLRYSF